MRAWVLLIAVSAAAAWAGEPKPDADLEAVLTSLREGETALLCVQAGGATQLTLEFNRRLKLLRRRVATANAEHVTATVDPTTRGGRHTLCAVISRSADESQPNFVRHARTSL